MENSLSAPKNNNDYKVLARKYRPSSFADLIGQDALVRTLRNAIASGRIAHAFMLTGIRGVGKTTTARIIAKALNYTGADGKSEKPTSESTDDCPVCQAISEDRHPDVIEMDAASRTGVDDIRAVLDGVRYPPTSARYKIYIIDEVHMLSKSAFNALLKTLEEPPPHVIFIFATTEIRKVPTTVLSRCQRFDLRRVDMETLSQHYKNICEKENIKAEDEAISVIAQAAEGSVRDGLSLLDQAITLSNGEVTLQIVQDMLGMADRTKVLELLESAMKGDINTALEIFSALYTACADPVTVIKDLMTYTHIISRLNVAPNSSPSSLGIDGNTLETCKIMASNASVAALSKTWQILLKGVKEVEMSGSPRIATEMLLIRLAYAANLPDPAELLESLNGGNPSIASTSRKVMNNGGSITSNTTGAVSQTSVTSTHSPSTVTSLNTAHALSSDTAFDIMETPRNLEQIVEIIRENGSPLLAENIRLSVHLLNMSEGRLEIALAPDAPSDIAQNMSKTLFEIYGKRWIVSIKNVSSLDASAIPPTLAQKAQSKKDELLKQIKADSLVQNVISFFPNAIVSLDEDCN